VYLLNRRIGIHFWGPDGRVRAGVMGAGSLILIPPEDFPITFLVFFWGVRLAVAFCLPSQVLDVPALAPAEGSLSASPLEGWAKTRMAGIGISPSKPRMGEIKLCRAYIQTIKTWDPKKMKKDWIDQGTLQGPFLLQHGRSAPVHRSTSRKCPEISLRGALLGAPKLYFLGSLELGLGVRSTPSPDGLVSSIVGLGRPANGWPRRLPSNMSPSGDWSCYLGQRLGGARVESVLRSKFPRTRGDGLKMEGGWARCSRNRTISHVMRTCLSWIQPHPHVAIRRHLLNTVNSFLCSSTMYFEN
jgi:hypothetical protein